MRGMFAARAVTLLAAPIPFSDFFCLDVVIDGVASIARWSSGPLHVVGRIEWLPPIRSLRNHVRPPNLVSHIPLCAFGIIVVADLLEVTLLPDAAVDEGDVVFRELCVRDRVR